MEPPQISLEQVDPAIVEAIEKARAEVHDARRSGEAWGKLATILAVHDFAKEADFCFAQAEQFSPRDARWPYLRGLMKSGENPEAAMASFGRAAHLCGDMPAPHLRYGEALLERGRLEEASAEFQTVLKREPNNARGLLGMGRVALAQGRLEESRMHLTASLSNAPLVKASHVLLASIEQRQGHAGDAERLQARARDLPEQPEWPDPYLIEANRFRTGKVASANIADDLLRKSRVAEAIQLMEQAVKRYPDFGKAWLLLGKGLMRQTNAAAAERALRQAVQLDPGSVDARLELGSAFFARGNYKEAETIYREVIAIKPNLGEGWFNLGLALMNQQNSEGAIEAFRKATEFKPDLTYAYIRWGQALGRLNRPNEAAEQIERALKLSPENQEAKEMMEILAKFRTK